MPIGIYKRKPFSKEHRENISKALKIKGIMPPYETRFQKGHISFMKGKHHREEAKNKLSLANIGKKLSEETREKISKAFKGEKGYWWKGGVTSKIMLRINKWKWKELRKKVYARDNWSCQLCKKHCKKSGINCHHIIPYRISQDDNLENLITLCTSCHMKKEREYQKKELGVKE